MIKRYDQKTLDVIVDDSNETNLRFRAGIPGDILLSSRGRKTDEKVARRSVEF